MRLVGLSFDVHSTFVMLGQGMLVLRLERRLVLEHLDDLPGRSDRAGYVHECLVADDVREVVDLSEQLCLYLLYVLLMPHLGSYHWSPYVDKDAPG